MASKWLASSVEFELLVFVLCYCFLFLARVKAEVPAMYVFGDSLADAGNNNYLKLSILKANFPHNGVDYPGGKATGRFSNGMNFIDFLAENLDSPSPLPYLSLSKNSNNRTQAFLNGISFASGGSGTLNSTNNHETLSLSKQIEYYSTVYTELVAELGSRQVLDHLSHSIFAFVIGSNDILHYVRKNSSLSLLISVEQLLDSMLSSLQAQLQRAYNLGARKFAVVGTGPVGCCPEQRKKSSLGECDDRANSISIQFGDRVSSLLQEMVPDLGDMKYSFFNTSIALSEYIDNPENYGFEEAKSACCGLGSLNAGVACLPFSHLCANRSSHIFWDLFHPTEATARLLTSTFFGGSSPYVFPINVKQLSDL